MNILNAIITFILNVLYYTLYPFYYIAIELNNRFKK